MNQEVFASAFKELQQANYISSWRGEGRMNQGNNALQSGDVNKAEKAFKATIAIEPYFDTSYINLADLYRSLQKPAQVNSVLIKGMKNLPKSGTIKYYYGLHLVRQKSLAKAVIFLKNLCCYILTMLNMSILIFWPWMEQGIVHKHLLSLNR